MSAVLTIPSGDRRCRRCAGRRLLRLAAARRRTLGRSHRRAQPASPPAASLRVSPYAHASSVLDPLLLPVERSSRLADVSSICASAFALARRSSTRRPRPPRLIWPPLRPAIALPPRSIRAPCPSDGRRVRPCSRSRAASRASSTQIRDVPSVHLSFDRLQRHSCFNSQCADLWRPRTT